MPKPARSRRPRPHPRPRPASPVVDRSSLSDAPRTPAAPRAPDAPRARLAVERSRISGLGAFALEPIAARRKVGELTGERVSVRTARRRARAQDAIAIVELSATHAIDATRSRSPIRYVNHACSPNCFLRIAYGRVELYALRAIAAGEELTCDYGATHHDGKLACRCASGNCRGWI